MPGLRIAAGGVKVTDLPRNPGLYPDIPDPLYHSDRDSLSVTGAKLILKSPAKFRYRLDHPEHKDVFDFGTAAHRLVLGVGATIRRVDSDSWRTKAAQEARDEARAAGEVALLAKDHDTVLAMADKLSEHTTATALLSNGRPEVSAYALDEPTGVMRRGRFDWLNEDMLVDYKTAAAADARQFGQAAAKFGYDMQAAWYLDLARANDLDPRGFVFIVQEKEPPYEVACIQLDPYAVEAARALNDHALERFRDCTASGIWPGHTPDLIVSAEVPSWRWAEYQTIPTQGETA